MFPLSFYLGEMGIFLEFFPLPFAWGPGLMPVEGLFLPPASIQAQIISWKEYAEMEQQQ